jgi:hypothetical protein
MLFLTAENRSSGSQFPRFSASAEFINQIGTLQTFASHRPYVSSASKARTRGRAALGRYPLVGDRPEQCLVSDGFETMIGRADKAKPIQSKKFAIHALGHVPTFSTLRG